MSGPLISAVVGLNYGDEGKGRQVDRLCRLSKERHGYCAAVVVRHNSGCQAGHTVTTSELYVTPHRHVFHHVGSGALAFARTWLGHKFVCNPYVFNAEFEAIQAQHHTEPVVMVDPRCMISTPLDVLLNQETELNRAGAAHGSCGVGFGETIGRYEAYHPNTFNRAGDVLTTAVDRELYTEYFREQFEARGLTPSSRNGHVVEAVLEGRYDWRVYDEQLRLFHSRVELQPFDELSMDELIFEGAQGMLLDMNNAAAFPHVTRCRTGLDDVIELLDEATEYDDVHAYLCTRSYVTRHGNGPFPAERTWETMIEKGYKIVDETNVPNDWQGTLRFAELQPLDAAYRAITHTQDSSANRRVHTHLVLSCADQAPEHVAKQQVDVLGSVAESLTIGRGPEAQHSEVVTRSTSSGARRASAPARERA